MVIDVLDRPTVNIKGLTIPYPEKGSSLPFDQKRDITGSDYQELIHLITKDTIRLGLPNEAVISWLADLKLLFPESMQRVGLSDAYYTDFIIKYKELEPHMDLETKVYILA